MNEQMRRYLDDEWNEQHEAAQQEAARRGDGPGGSRQDSRAAPDPRRQKSKEWGRAMFKFQKQQRRARES